jgi:hypothetical protein
MYVCAAGAAAERAGVEAVLEGQKKGGDAGVAGLCFCPPLVLLAVEAGGHPQERLAMGGGRLGVAEAGVFDGQWRLLTMMGGSIAHAMAQ